ncbi:S-adenosyl-L-methionine-dependent methyltransferase [Sporormia fimetaria CBS 119925]|uniref:S-adenosyl-L-methionine-dependent methyltransferase n=1 Tax=Sporormia fimetaria CBS 119925 TaxID=1340428 RepID=A0A6A6VG11_9PLEO|nr:S-adenosyl-L-methionine-dependent methyltransferase [Sporormia fimetaria CBS 119925]
MSLYYEAASILANPDKTGGSLKSRIYKKKDLKSSPAQIVALVTEASKWSGVLKDVIERSGLLAEEKKLTPTLALLLTYDLLISKGGVAAPASHVLKISITRHKARLQAELTRSRVKAGHPTLDAFKDALERERNAAGPQHPRWVRVNTLKTSLGDQLTTTFGKFKEVESLAEVMSAPASSKIYFVDPHILNLLALPPRIDLSKTGAYLAGQIIFQDKASCFPAYLLDPSGDGDVIDGCAAPGNKTTHVAAILKDIAAQDGGSDTPTRVIAFERDRFRAKILNKMVKLASADGIVSIKAAHDFTEADPEAEEYANVTDLLLDPSCSGTGIVGRDDAITMHLPSSQGDGSKKTPSSKKRKRNVKEETVPESETTLQLDMDDSVPEETPVEDKLSERLTALSAFQLRILKHAMCFPKARRITYSTCSIHFEENEAVVFQALASKEATRYGWSILKRRDQVSGMKSWPRRGVWEDDKLDKKEAEPLQRQEILDACIRCEKGTDDGTMGFFVAAFIREEGKSSDVDQEEAEEAEEDEWNGFSGDEAGTAEPAAVVEKVVSAEPGSKKKKRRKQ